MTQDEILACPFATLSDLVGLYARQNPTAIAVADAVHRLDWSELDSLADRIAARLQNDGFVHGNRTAIAGLNSVEQVAVIIGTLRAGGGGGTDHQQRDRRTNGSDGARYRNGASVSRCGSVNQPRGAGLWNARQDCDGRQ